MVCSFEFECKAFINLPHEMKGARACVHVNADVNVCRRYEYVRMGYLHTLSKVVM